MARAAVDIPHKVHRQLAVLGPKLYFIEIRRSQEKEEYYLEHMNYSYRQQKQAIQNALIEYLSVFEANPQITMEGESELGLPKIPIDSKKSCRTAKNT